MDKFGSKTGGHEYKIPPSSNIKYIYLIFKLIPAYFPSMVDFRKNLAIEVITFDYIL